MCTPLLPHPPLEPSSCLVNAYSQNMAAGDLVGACTGSDGMAKVVVIARSEEE